MMKEPSEPPAKPPVVPMQYSGLWVAWNEAQTEIVGSGRTLAQARAAARSRGEMRPLLAKVPSANVRFVGSVR
jgi:hypothetical protein